MVSCDWRALDVAKFDEARFDYARFDVFTPAYQKAFAASARTLTRRVPAFHVSRENASFTVTTWHLPHTGWREPPYTDESICGVLVEKGQQSAFIGAGIVVKLDATLRTLDGVFAGDQIFDAQTEKYYAVADEPFEYMDSRKTSFAWRDCPLRWLPYYRKGHD